MTHQNVAFKILQGLGGVSKAKSHEKKFPEANGGGNSCFGDVVLGDGDLMVRFYKVQPTMQSLRDCMLGRGYLSGTVTTLRRR
jgi:hypothetical protein